MELILESILEIQETATLVQILARIWTLRFTNVLAQYAYDRESTCFGIGSKTTRGG